MAVHARWFLVALMALLAGTVQLPGQAATDRAAGLAVRVTFAPGSLDGPVDGRTVVLVSRSSQPLSTVAVTSRGTSVFGSDAFSVGSGSTVVLGGDADPAAGVYGFSKADAGVDGLVDLPPGDYYVQAVFKRYERLTRSDGSQVSLHVPCGDGGAVLNSAGNLTSDVVRVSVGSNPTVADLSLDEVIQPSETVPPGGTCEQGNPTAPLDSGDLLRYEKIRSEVLSDFWGRDVFVGANVLLPAGYDLPENADERYPVIYSQSHWPGDSGAFGYPYDQAMRDDWDAGEAPAVIMVTLRMETPFYDTSYGVNSANQGPWGDAVAEELVPFLDATYRTVPERWARAQTGGSTGGWMAAAMTAFRPDLYGSAWAEYPDSLDFHAHQAVDLYDGASAYVDGLGQPIGSWHNYDPATGADTVEVTMSQENRYELALGGGSRSFDQWDVWNATWSPQGSNGLPLDPWNKLTGVIDHEATELWRPFDLSDYVTRNWAGDKRLGEVLRHRLHIWVGTEDTFYLDGGVERFEAAVSARGGSDWAEFTYGHGEAHGWTPYPTSLDLVQDIYDFMVADRADGTAGEGAADLATSIGNTWAEVLAHGGHQAALSRLGTLTTGGDARVGGVLRVVDDGLESGSDVAYQWLRDGAPIASATAATYLLTPADAGHSVVVRVLGRKLGYDDRTLTSAATAIPRLDAAAAAPPVTLAPQVRRVGRAKVGRVVRIRASAVAGTLPPTAVSTTHVWRVGRRVLGTGPTLRIPRRALGRRLVVLTTFSAPGAASVTVRTPFGKVRPR